MALDSLAFTKARLYGVDFILSPKEMQLISTRPSSKRVESEQEINVKKL